MKTAVGNPVFHPDHYHGVYALVGQSAFGFFFVQGMTLLASLAMSYLLARWISGGSRLAGYAACMMLLISAPYAESYFTLDKVEPRLIFFSLILLGYFALRITREGQIQSLSGEIHNLLWVYEKQPECSWSIS